jgi:hypothetical protein
MTNKSNKSNYKSYLLLFITLCIISSSLSIRVKSLKALSICVSNCYEIIQQNGKDYKISFTYTAPKTTTVNLAIKFVLNCDTPGDLKVIVDNWLADGKLINSDVTASITGTSCLPLSDITFSGRQLSLFVLGSQSTCGLTCGTEFTLNLTYTSNCLIKCSTICKLTIEQDPVPGSVKFEINPSDLCSQGCPDPLNLILSAINSQGVTVATTSTEGSNVATINNLPVGTYTTGLISDTLLCNTGYVDILPATFTIISGTTICVPLTLTIRPFAQITLVITNFPSAIISNIVGTITDLGTGATVATVLFTTPTATVDINLPNGDYTINLQGVGDVLSGDFFSPISQAFTVNNVDQQVDITYSQAAVHGVSFAFYTYTGPVTLEFTSANYIIANLTANSPSTGNTYYFPNQDVTFAVVSPTGQTVTYAPGNAIITSCTTYASVTIAPPC